MLEGFTRSQNDPINFVFTNIVTYFGGIYDFRTNVPKKHYDLVKKTDRELATALSDE
jgi:hypothetical protein